MTNDLTVTRAEPTVRIGANCQWDPFTIGKNKVKHYELI